MYIVFTVTNELHFDQRMIRICDSLKDTGFDVELIGVRFDSSAPLRTQTFHQKRLRVFFKKGFCFYAEYNIRLFFYLLFKKFDAVCCIDLDTMLPAYFISRLRKKIRIYDAHEYFSQLKEIVTRPRIYHVWSYIERTFVPKFKLGYTVSESIAHEFFKLYGVNYKVIRNIPPFEKDLHFNNRNKTLLYQGSVNEARGFEYLIPAMKQVTVPLHIYGKGNFFGQTKKLIIDHGLMSRVFLHEYLTPTALAQKTAEAYIGLNLVEQTGLNQYYSLANKFFDYIQHGLPQITMNFPEYRRINMEFEVAILIDHLTAETIAEAIHTLLNDHALYNKLHLNCLEARKIFCWQKEEIILHEFYKDLLE